MEAENYPDENSGSKKLQYRRNEVAELKARYNTCIGSGESGSCNQAPSNFENAKGAFVGACRALPTAANPNDHSANPASNIGCGWNLARCSCQGMKPGDPSYTNLNCGGVDSTLGPAPTGNGVRDTRYLPICTISASTDLEKLEKDIREQQNQLREMQRRKPELEQQQAEALSQGDEKMQQAREKAAEAAKQRAQQRAEAVKQQREAMKTVAREITNIQQQISSLDEASTQQNGKRTDAEIARQDAINNIEGTCHKQAVEQVSGEQQQAAARAATGTYSRGGFNQMLRNTGISDRSQWQRVALKYYKQCMQSQITRNSIKAANKVYEAKLESLNAGSRDLDKRKAALQAQILQLQNNNGCSGAGTGVNANGSSTDSQACQAVRQLAEDIEKSEADFRSQMMLAAQQENNARKDMDRKAGVKRKELIKLTQDIQGEETRLRNLRNLLAAKQAHASGSMDAKDAADVWSKYGSMMGAADSLIGCKTETQCNENASCRAAAAFKKLIGQSVNYYIPPPSTSVTSHSSGPAVSTPASPPTATPTAPQGGATIQR